MKKKIRKYHRYFPCPTFSNRSRASIRSIYFSLTFKKQTTFLRFGRKNVYSIGKANLLQREISSVGGGRGEGEREKGEKKGEISMANRRY